MRLKNNLLIALVCFFIVFAMACAQADAFSELAPGCVTTTSRDGVGLYAQPSCNDQPDHRIGPGVSMQLHAVQNGWAQVSLTVGSHTKLEGYVRSESLVMNDYGLGHDVMRVIAQSPQSLVPLRETPEVGSALLGEYHSGMLITYYNTERNGYARVAIGELVGYMPLKRLQPYDPHDQSHLADAKTVEQTALCSRKGMVLGTLPSHTQVSVLGYTPDGRCHVMICGQTGYVPREALRFAQTTPP